MMAAMCTALIDDEEFLHDVEKAVNIAKIHSKLGPDNVNMLIDLLKGIVDVDDDTD